MFGSDYPGKEAALSDVQLVIGDSQAPILATVNHQKKLGKKCTKCAKRAKKIFGFI